MKKWFVYPALLLLTTLVCCHRWTYSKSKTNQDSTEVIEDIETLQRKAEMAENEVLAYVKNDTANRWTQHEFGWWYRYLHKSDMHTDIPRIVVSKDTCCLIHEVVYNLNGTLLVDAIREFDSSRQEECEPSAYILMMSKLVPQDTVIMLIAWPEAYGRQGRGYVPPRTNICVRLNLHATPYTDVPLSEDIEINSL